MEKLCVLASVDVGSAVGVLASVDRDVGSAVGELVGAVEVVRDLVGETEVGCMEVGWVGSVGEAERWGAWSGGGGRLVHGGVGGRRRWGCTGGERWEAEVGCMEVGCTVAGPVVGLWLGDKVGTPVAGESVDGAVVLGASAGAGTEALETEVVGAGAARVGGGELRLGA
ncbi:hypothetical protein CYMTET_28092, partial [Cymbomonas tetramitiformis]